ncbi:MAG: AAA domain-containing protein [Spirochaetales bacterium]|nr:AAA domain-containing protein [Spirochaetales bacterium]
MDELVQLEKDLGITGSGEPLYPADLARKLTELRPEWPWIEKADSKKLQAPLSRIKQEGIFDRAILLLGERSPFTQGLEAELKALSEMEESEYRNTALGHWIQGEVPEKAEAPRKSLIEVLPLNTEQRDSIHKALNNNITIITGPPGTGKSQVVSDLLLNAAWQGKRVLFASKNNKAVDVVEERINGLGPRPVLIRVGSNQNQSKLAEYLLGLLSSTCTEEDFQAFEEQQENHRRIENELKTLDNQLNEIVECRNTVDRLEQDIEQLRKEFPSDTIPVIKENGPIKKSTEVKEFYEAVRCGTYKNLTFFEKLFWRGIKKKRYASISRTSALISDFLKRMDLSLPEEDPEDETISDWNIFCDSIDEKIAISKDIYEYFSALKTLQTSEPIESIHRSQAGKIKELSKSASELWRKRVLIQPSQISREDRALLSKYNTLLKMIIDTKPGQKVGYQILGQYSRMTSEIAHLLPCWAVTSLSAKGKIPFVPGYFDLVVIDESSQCDIASALPLLYRAKQVAIIGDPKQLSHISSIQPAQDNQLLEKYDMVQNYANWSYTYNSLFDLATGVSLNKDIVNLRDHHRSHAKIIGFSNKFFYEDQLRVATKYESLNFPSQDQQGLSWRDVAGEVFRPESGGALNRKEAYEVVKLISELLFDQNYKGSIGVVSPFRAQANVIRQLINQNQVLEERLIQSDFLVDTVHKFQGDERDVMIFSPVLSKKMTKGAIRFLQKNGNLFNVAITRARAMLYVVGDKKAALNSEISYLHDFAEYVDFQERQAEPVDTDDRIEHGPEYPRVSNPESVSDWERMFYKALYSAGVRTLPQYQVENYTLDFALFVGDRKLNIEVDGEQYHRNWTGELCRRDQIRNQRLIELGWDIKRFWVYELRDDLENCIYRVKDWVSI